MGQLFDVLLVHPLINLLVAIYQILAYMHIPSALGFSIILLTIVLRLLLYPLIASQLRASKKMQDINPHLSKLKEKHKNDAKRLQQETMLLYKEHGINPIAGCLPMLVQIPVFYALYAVLNQIAHPKGIDAINNLLYSDAIKLKALWDTHFFGLPLDKTPANILSTFTVIAIAIPVVTGALQFIQSKMMFVPQPKAQDGKKEQSADFASVMQSQTTYIIPVMFGFFAFNFPIALALYWNTFTIFGIIQQYQMQGLGGLSSWFAKTPTTPQLSEVKKKRNG